MWGKVVEICPGDPITFWEWSWNLNTLLRRWLYTRIILWQGDWIPRDLHVNIDILRTNIYSNIHRTSKAKTSSQTYTIHTVPRYCRISLLYHRCFFVFVRTIRCYLWLLFDDNSMNVLDVWSYLCLSMPIGQTNHRNAVKCSFPLTVRKMALMLT